MIVNVLGRKKYKCGCGRGVNKLDKPGILKYLNLIMEWDQCRFPMKLKDDYVQKKDEDGNPVQPEKSDYIEDRTLLGDDPELEPGDTFELDGQFIAVDSPDRLVLMISETGPWALDRIWTEKIKPEIDLFNDASDLDVVWEDLPEDPNPDEFDGEVRIPSFEYNVWKERFLTGREKDFKVSKSGLINISCEVTSEELPYDVHIILQNYSAKYKTEELFEPEIATETVKALLCWFCNEFTRKVNPLDIEDEKREKMQEKQK